ncbi:MAG: hypothetical protein F6K47_00760 [Symploca sp. SIO2E6]|nr:hypothetical protein [Symploca sp. SIO2E6]
MPVQSWTQALKPVPRYVNFSDFGITSEQDARTTKIAFNIGQLCIL